MVGLRVVNLPHSCAIREITCGKFSRRKLDVGNAVNFEGEKTLKNAIFSQKMASETKSETVFCILSSSMTFYNDLITNGFILKKISYVLNLELILS